MKDILPPTEGGEPVVETEQAVIGCLILDWAACRQPDVEPEWFETAFYGEIVRRGRKLEAAGIQPDHVTLLEGMNEEGRREVRAAAQLVPSIPSYPNYVRQLKQECGGGRFWKGLRLSGWRGNDADDMAEGLRTLLAGTGRDYRRRPSGGRPDVDGSVRRLLQRPV